MPHKCKKKCCPRKNFANFQIKSPHDNGGSRNHEPKKKPVPNLKNKQIIGFEQTLQNLLRFLFHNKNFFLKKTTIVETISVVINDSSDKLCCLSVTVEDLGL